MWLNKPKTSFRVSEVLMCLVLMLSGLLAAIPSTAQAFSGVGNGSLSYPYRISTCDEFHQISNKLFASYVLINDIDCSGYSWTYINGFSGNLDGRNHTVDGITITGANTSGVFAYASNANFKNLYFTNLSVSGSNNIGALAGEVDNSIISNVHVSGSVGGTSQVGGLASGIGAGTQVSNSSFTGTVYGSGAWAGGLFSTIFNASVTNSYVNATLTGAYGGGLAGVISATGGGNIDITKSYVIGDINFSGAADHRAGLVEKFYKDSGSTINMTDNFVVANTHGSSIIYSMVESGSSGTPQITNTYFDATAAGTSTACVVGNPVVGCTAVNTDGTDSNHFKNTSAVAPLTSWDFSNVWQQTSSYPDLRYPAIPLLLGLNPPGEATNLQASAGTPKSTVNLSWDAAPDGGSDVTYQVRYRDLTAGEVSYTTFGTSTMNTSLAITGLTLHHQYEFKVKSINPLGNALSSSITFTTSSINTSSITNCEELQAIDDNLHGNYTLANDINCLGSADWNDGQGFSPIGLALYGDYFTGTLDGQGHTIYGLNMNRSSSEAGLFLHLSDAAVHDLNINHPIIRGLHAAGTVAPYVDNSDIYDIRIDNADVSTSFGYYAGGVAGYYSAGVSHFLSNAYFDGNVSGQYSVGGLVGYSSYIEIRQSYSAGTVSGVSSVGGLAGSHQNAGLITNSYSHANVIATGDYVGGLVGALGDNMHASPGLSNSYASGNVITTGDYAGGLVGVAEGYVANSFSAGRVTALVATHVGGFAGDYDAGSGSSTNNAYDQLRSDQSGASTASMPEITPINTTANPDSGYFFNNVDKAPMQNWDTTLWFSKANNFPVLYREPNDTTEVSTQNTATSITVHWAPPNDNETFDITGYTIEYRLGDLSNGWTSVSGISPASSNSYTITGLKPDTAYSIAIFTEGGGTMSQGVGIIAYTQLAPQLTPGNLGGNTKKLPSPHGGNSLSDSLAAVTMPDSLTSNTTVTIDNSGDYLTSGHTSTGLHVGDVVHFMATVHDKLEEHTATVKEIGNDYVILTIASTPFDLRIGIGESQDVSVNRDGENNVRIALSNVSGGSADITFKALSATATTAAKGDNAHTPSRPGKWLWAMGIVVLLFVVLQLGRRSRRAPKA